MSDSVTKTTLALFLIAACASGNVVAQMHDGMDLGEISLSGKTPESIILLWPTYSYHLARLMISKYGQPAEATDHSLVWLDNGPWKRTVVYRVPPGERALGRSRGRLEQSVAYRVPTGQLDALARFDKDIEADVKAGRLTARSDDESLNFLSLNLADEILQGLRTAREASDFRRDALRLRDAGKSSPYLDGLMFVKSGRPPDPESPD